MKHVALWIAAASLAVTALAPSARADEVVGKLIASRADAVVAVRFVLNLHVEQDGEARDIERSGTAVGVLVSDQGLVVVANEALAPNIEFPGVKVTTTPTNIRVVFPGDPKEYDAVLGATDSRLGLAFLRIRDLEGRAVVSVALDGESEVQIGTRLYGVSRLSQGFDHAPYCDTAVVTGWVTKPRKMWLLSGSFLHVGHPLFDAEGRVVGVVIEQEGVGERGALRFLLPLKVVRSTVERAAREADRILEEEGEREAEENAAEPPESSETEKPGNTSPGGDVPSGESD